MLDESNRVVQLEKEVRELKRKLDQRPDKQEIVQEVKRQLSAYEDEIRSDKGKIKMKKNFVMENRKGKLAEEEGGDPKIDNVMQMYFNDKDARLNHIFIGSASKEGYRNTSVIGNSVVHKTDLGDGIPNNGTIQFGIYYDDELDDRQRFDPSIAMDSVGGGPSIPSLSMSEKSNFIPGTRGKYTNMQVTGKDGELNMGHVNNKTLDYNSGISIVKDKITTLGPMFDEEGFRYARVHVGPEPPETEDETVLWVDNS